MIVVAYPCASGGNFLAATIALMRDRVSNNITKDGSMHGEHYGFRPHYTVNAKANTDAKSELELEQEDLQLFLEKWYTPDLILAGHFKNLKSIVALYPDTKVLYITIDIKSKIMQQDNFFRKVIVPYWGERAYNMYKSSRWPEFAPIDQMPDFVITDLHEINKKYVSSWNMVLPLSTDRTLEITMSDLLNGDLLISTLSDFLDIKIDDTHRGRVLQFINDYKHINGYE